MRDRERERQTSLAEQSVLWCGSNPSCRALRRARIPRGAFMASDEAATVVRKLREDLSLASPDDLIDALAQGEQQLVQLRLLMQSALDVVVRPWFAEIARLLGSEMAAKVAQMRRAQAVAQTVDSVFAAFREPLMALLHDDSLGLKAAVGEEAMHEIKVATRITAAAATKVESQVVWTPPAMQDDVKAALTKMADAQKAAEGQLRDGKDASSKLDELRAARDAARRRSRPAAQVRENLSCDGRRDRARAGTAVGTRSLPTPTYLCPVAPPPPSCFP